MSTICPKSGRSPSHPFPLEEYNNAFMEVQLRDMGSCFNLNSLAAGQGSGGQAGQTGQQTGQSGKQQATLAMRAFKEYAARVVAA